MSPRISIAVVFSIFAASPFAVAQSAAPNANAPAVAPSQDATVPLLRENRDAASDADARLCLEYPTNRQIIMCAEKYRTNKRNS
jgi:hypothetical protein